MKSSILSKKELLFLITISLALGIRQMAMTMVMPFISTYGQTLKYSNGTLVGVALGIFGLSQAIFQVPFGMLSDKIGNKIVMLIGIMQVIIGLIIAFLAKDIYVLIFARALQGSGAVVATGYAWISGSVESEKRPRALSIVGIIIGFAASFSFALGPIFHKYLSVKNMFLMCAALIFLVWIIILLFLKNNIQQRETVNKEKESKDVIIKLMKDKSFLALNIEGFFNNFIMVSVFYVVPQYLDKITGIDGMWRVFMPAVIIAIIFMRVAVRVVEKGYGEKLISISFLISAIGVTLYFNNNSFWFILMGSILFMIGYICLSTIIPSLANDIAEDSYRGVANGIINSFQYIGSFVGAVITGALWTNHKSVTLILTILICLSGIVSIKILGNKKKA